ncbi:hypothetical protein [Cytobacillus oceanisediminis]|uniref:hypothetical protein n=1 Tax=Cytobacillus oceanisediminis TaxID=665099 RepID=UPI00164288C5|nr:hypothetical protein [Cytobacillus oceanisediminis]
MDDLPDYLVNPQSKVKYTYDSAGNRLTMTDDEGATEYTYNAMNQLQTGGKERYEYDDNGNVISKTNSEGKVQSSTATTTGTS